jgi:hypothetical protein
MGGIPGGSGINDAKWGNSAYEVVLSPAAIGVVIGLPDPCDRKDLAAALRTELMNGPNADKEYKFDSAVQGFSGRRGSQGRVVYTATPLSFGGYTALYRRMTREELRRLRREKGPQTGSLGFTEFRKDDARPDAAAGLRWVAATLEHVIDNEEAVCNSWPDVDDAWLGHVKQAAGELDNHGIPDHLLTGTKNLFLQMILQNAGVHRREAIETVVTSGWNEPVARALAFLLKTERTEAWLRVRAEFALGFLQKHDTQVEESLTRSCEHAYRNLRLTELADDEKPERSHVTEMHASLFAVGDCFGVAGAEGRARSARDRLRPILEDLAQMTQPRALILRRAARAAAYLLTVTAQPRVGGEKDLSEELLEKLSRHPDPVTARLSRWAVKFRFDPAGETIRPFLAAADYDDDAPY